MLAVPAEPTSVSNARERCEPWRLQLSKNISQRQCHKCTNAVRYLTIECKTHVDFDPSALQWYFNPQLAIWKPNHAKVEISVSLPY